MALSRPVDGCPTARVLEALPLPEAVVLAAYEATHGRGWPWDAEICFGVAAALLLELAFAERVILGPEGVRVNRADVTGDVVTDRALDVIVRGGVRRPVAWVNQLATWVLPSVRQRLVTRGMLLCRPGRRLWLIPADDYLVDPDHSILRTAGHLRICAHSNLRPVAFATLMVAMGLFPPESAPSAVTTARSGLAHYPADPPPGARQAMEIAGTAVRTAIRGASALYAPGI